MAIDSISTDPYADHGAIKELVTTKRREWAKGREPFIRAAYRNILFYRGIQWIKWDRTINRWRPARLPRNTPTPVTNIFACLDGETTIPCLDGTTPTIRELATRSEMPWVFGFDTDTLRIVPALAERVWKTGERECVRVEFEEGTSVICTPDHKFLTWKRGYVAANELLAGESVIPCLPGKNDNRYPYIVQPADVKHEPVHRMVAADIYGPIPVGYHVHHRNEDRADNRPENLEVLSASAHMRHTALRNYATGAWLGTKDPQHPDRMRALWKTPWYRDAQRIARLTSWAGNPQRRETARQQLVGRRDLTTGRINHRVRAVVSVGVREIFDLMTPRTQNFGIGAGVFVHNSTMDALTSIFARIEPTLNFRPGTPEEAADRAAADVSVRAIEVIEDEVAIRENRQMLAQWVGLTGQGWIETGYDPDPIHGMKFQQQDQCAACGQTQAPGQKMCEACGQPGLQPAVDGQGQPAGEEVPIGRMYMDVCSIFEMFFDASVVSWRKQRAYIREKSVSMDEAKARWPNLADSITPNVMAEGESWYADALPLLGPNIEENQTGRMAQAGAARPLNNRVTEQWFWQLPNATYADGLLAVILGRTQVAYAGPLPYSALMRDGSRKPFLPHVFFPQKLVPGTAFAKTVADDLAMKQSQRNRWESIIEACGMRMGSPVWLKPMGANVTNLTGDPGNIIGYNAVGPNAAKPERIPGQGIPLSFVHMIQDIDKSFEELAATFDVIKGARPPGVSAGIALQILQERGMSRHNPLFILWEQAWAEWASQALEIFREFATEPRLLRIKGRDGGWQVSKFLGADLQGQVDVISEAGSSMPRSSLLDRTEMEQLASMHIIDINDPEIRWKFLEVYGRTNLTPQMASDTKNAIRENEMFEGLAQNPTIMQAIPEDVQAIRTMPYHVVLEQMERRGVKLPRVRPAVDDHVIHLREIKAWLKSESSQKLPEFIQALGEMHAEYHQQLLQLQAQALQQGGPSLPVPGGAFSQGPARQNPLMSGSSGNRMMGDMQEMQDQTLSSVGA